MWTPTPSNRESYKTTREAAMAAFAKSWSGEGRVVPASFFGPSFRPRQCQLRTFQSRRCAMPLMPAFRRRKTSAAIVGRLLAGYGELEFLLAFCVGAADASRIAPKPGQQIGAHRWY